MLHQRVSLVSGEADIKEEEAEEDGDELFSQEQATDRMPTVYVLATKSNSKTNNKFGQTMPMASLKDVLQKHGVVAPSNTASKDMQQMLELGLPKEFRDDQGSPSVSISRPSSPIRARLPSG